MNPKNKNMKTIEFKQTLTCCDDYQVIVVGGGPAGCTAAAAAAREGVKVLLVEATGSLGGMGTGGLVPAWCPFSDKEKIIYRGLAQTVFERAKAGMAHVQKDAMDWVPIDPELLKRVYDDLVVENGADVLFNSLLCGVNRNEQGTVESIILAGKNGLVAYHADVFIDCTGDADLAVWAGAQYKKGNEDGDLQPATHCFMLANVDDYAYRHGKWLHPNNPTSPIYDIRASKKYPLIPDVHCCNNLVGPGVVGFNAGHLWQVDNTDPQSVSQALIKGRKMAAQFRDALAEFAPAAFGNAFLVETGSLMGIRETRRIVGDYTLVVDDYLSRRSFPDEICRNSYYLDVHSTEKATPRKPEDREDSEKKACRMGPGESHGIPYRCLTPVGLRNVLVAGRSISTDRQVMGSTRVMPVCLAMGEAAGIAAAMAANKTSDVHQVDTDKLRTRLRECGAYLPTLGA